MAGKIVVPGWGITAWVGVCPGKSGQNMALVTRPQGHVLSGKTPTHAAIWYSHLPNYSRLNNVWNFLRATAIILVSFSIFNLIKHVVTRVMA